MQGNELVSVRKAPGLEIKLDRFAKIGASAVDILTLRSDVQLWAAHNIPAIFFGNQRGESVRHKPMLANVNSASKAL